MSRYQPEAIRRKAYASQIQPAMRSHLAALFRDFVTLYRYDITPAEMRQIARRRLGL